LPHIGIISDKKSSDGVPLIIHNIGSGTQEEDILFKYPNANSKMSNAIWHIYEVGGKRYTQPFENPNPCTNKGKL